MAHVRRASAHTAPGGTVRASSPRAFLNVALTKSLGFLPLRCSRTPVCVPSTGTRSVMAFYDKLWTRIERDGLLEFDMANLSERLGRELTVHDFLVNMTSYYGRIVVQDGLVQIHSEILPERFRD